MTKQIERAYRSNRRRSWLLIAAVVALAAVAIPIASGAPDKNYTLGFGADGLTATKSICVGDTVLVTMRLNNVAKAASLGAAKVTFPNFVTVLAKPTVSAPAATVTWTTGSRTVLFENLGLQSKTGATITVSLRADSTGSAPFTHTANGTGTVVVKQANSFNDSSGDANLFVPQGSLPTLAAANCVATIKGQIWNDSNENAGKDPLEVVQRPADGFSVRLYENGQLVSTPGGTGVALTYDATGYTFSNVPTGKSYVVCEAAATGTWKQTTGSVQTVCGTTLPNGWAFTLSDAGATGKDFGNARAVDACIATSSGTTKISTSTNDSTYTVWLPPEACKEEKPSNLLVFETYALSDVQRVANLHGDTAGGDVMIVEQMEWKFVGDAQPGAVMVGEPKTLVPRTLKYQDLPDQGVRPMPYCLVNPLDNPDFDPADEIPVVSDTLENDEIFPAAHTSCLISTVEDADHNRFDLALTKVDGYRAFP